MNLKIDLTDHYAWFMASKIIFSGSPNGFRPKMCTDYRLNFEKAL